MAQSHFPQRKGVPVSLVRFSRFLEDFPKSSRMGRARRLAGSRRVRLALNAFFVSIALAAAGLTALHFRDSGWPLANADMAHDHGFFVGNHPRDLTAEITHLRGVLDESAQPTTFDDDRHDSKPA